MTEHSSTPNSLVRRYGSELRVIMIDSRSNRNGCNGSSVIQGPKFEVRSPDFALRTSNYGLP
jgi:hypothetical protein